MRTGVNGKAISASKVSNQKQWGKVAKRPQKAGVRKNRVLVVWISQAVNPI